MLKVYYALALVLLLVALFLVYRRRAWIHDILSNNRGEASLFVFLTLFYFVLNQDIFEVGPRPVGDNYSYAFPYFNYLFQSFAVTGDAPFWNPLVNHGEPTFIFINHNFLLHAPYIPFYLLAPFIKDVDPYHIFWAAILLGNYIQALGIAYLVFILTGQNRIALFAMALGLFSGLSVGELHQMQINASVLYVPWSLSFLFLWGKSGRWVYWHISCALIGFSLINHYPHLVIYLWLILIGSWCLTNRQDIPKFFGKFSGSGMLHGVIGLGLIVIVALPTLWIFFEYSPQLVSPYRGENSLSLHAQYLFIENTKNSNSLNPHTLFHYFFPGGFMSLPGIGQTGISDNLIFYIGILPILFAIYDLYARPVSHATIKCAIFLVLIFGMGGYNFAYYILYNYFPFASLQRIPLHIADYLSLLLIIYSSLSLKNFLSGEIGSEPKDRLRALFFFPGLIIFVVLVVIYYMLRHGEPQAWRAILDDAAIFLMMISVFFWLYLNRQQKAFWIILFLFLLFDLGRYYHQNLKFQQQPRQVYFPKDLPRGADFFQWKNLFDFPGRYESGIVYHALLLGQPMLTRANSELVVFADYRRFREAHKSFFEEGADRILLNRIHFIPSGKFMPGINLNDLASFLQNGENHLGYEVIKSLPNEFALRVHQNQAGYLIWLDHADKWWSVEINGKAGSIIPFGPFKAVALQGGEAEIIWKYCPSWRWFVYLDILIYFILAAMLLAISFGARLSPPPSAIKHGPPG